MFRVILPGEHAEHRAILDAMHQLRDRIVVGQWKWEIPGARPGYEADAFDTDQTIYVLVREDEGEVTACARLNPTSCPHMMNTLFADYCDLQPWPTGPDIFECSRFVIDTVSVTDPLELFRIRCRLGIGITAWCLDTGVRQLSWLTHQRFYNHISGLFRTEPLGRPRRQGQGEDWAWIAAVSDIDLPALDRQLDRFRNAAEIIAALAARSNGGAEGEAA